MIKKLVALLLHTGLTRVAALGASFLLTFLLARSFTPEEYAVYGLIATAMFVLTPLGGLTLSSYVNRAVPGRDPVEQVGILKVTLLSEFGLAAIIGLVLIASGGVRLFVRWTNVEAYYGVFLGVIGLMVANSVQTELVQFICAKTRIQFANYMDLLLSSAWVPILLVLSLAGYPITVGVVLGLMIFGSVVSSIAGAFLVNWRAFRAAPFDRQLLRAGLAYSVPLIVPSMNYGLLRFIDRAFLASMADMHQIGLYVFGATLVNLIFSLSYRILTATMFPFIVKAHNEENLTERNLLLTYVLKASFILFVVGVVILRTGGYRLILPIIRPEYAGSVHWVVWIAITNVLLIFNYPGQTLLLLQNRTRMIMAIELTGLGIVVALSMLLIPRFGVMGGIMATWAGWGFVGVGEGMASGVLRVILWRQMLGYQNEIRMGREVLASLLSRNGGAGS